MATDQTHCSGCGLAFHDLDRVHQFVHLGVTYSIHAQNKCANLAIRIAIPELDKNKPVQLQREELLDSILRHIHQ